MPGLTTSNTTCTFTLKNFHIGTSLYQQCFVHTHQIQKTETQCIPSVSLLYCTTYHNHVLDPLHLSLVIQTYVSLYSVWRNEAPTLFFFYVVGSGASFPRPHCLRPRCPPAPFVQVFVGPLCCFCPTCPPFHPRKWQSRRPHPPCCPALPVHDGCPRDAFRHWR